MRIIKKIEGFVDSTVWSNKHVLEFLFLSLMVYVVLDGIILAWFFLTPLAARSNNQLVFGLGMLGYNIGYLVSNCHQMPERSLMFQGFEMPFCARDTGIYVGCLIGGILPFLPRKFPDWLKSPWFFIASVIPMAVDGVSQTIFDMRESTNELRLITGIIFGFGLVYVFAARVVEHSRGSIDMRAETVRAGRIAAIILLMLLAASYLEGARYVTLDEAVKQSGLNPTFVTYVGSRALYTIPYDPYLPTYDDAVLKQLESYGYRGHGVWVVYEGKMTYEGKYTYFSGGDGKFALISDRPG